MPQPHRRGFRRAHLDELFGRHVSHNEERRILASMPFRRDIVDRFVSEEPTQAVGSALLSWRGDTGITSSRNERSGRALFPCLRALGQGHAVHN